jgi:hypothetical protein
MFKVMGCMQVQAACCAGSRLYWVQLLLDAVLCCVVSSCMITEELSCIACQGLLTCMVCASVLKQLQFEQVPMV